MHDRVVSESVQEHSKARETDDSDARQTCLITGATSGHGRACAQALARRGWDLILVGRDRQRCAATVAEIGRLNPRCRVDVVLCELSDLDAVRRAAAAITALDRPLHALLNNAGLVRRDRQLTDDGFEMTFAVNYLAHYLLTRLLLDRIIDCAPARIINVSSDTHRIVSLPLDDLQTARGYSFMKSYGRSKLALVYFTLELARRLEGRGVRVNAVDPGPVSSRIARDNPGLTARLLPWIMKLFPSAPKAAQTAVTLLTSSAPRYAQVSGGYFKYGKRRRFSIRRDDPFFATRLWRKSAEMVGLD
jgi:NAD(P)-dependent dehydrogenase (short-subunit alcohol dehydrogenase family)